MKLTIERDALLAAMSRVGGIARKSSIPILSNVLLEAEGAVKGRAKRPSVLTLTATDLTIQTIVRVEAEVETPGRITVPAAQLADIAKSLAEGAQIKCELVDGRLNVSGGRARWKLPTLNPDSFPIMGSPNALSPDEQEAPEWTWEGAVTGTMLADLLSRVSWAVCTDQSRAFLAGVRLSVAAGEMVAAATQGRDIALAKMDAPDGEFAGVTVPSATAAEIVRLCGEAPDVTLRLSTARIGVETPTVSLVSKVIDGDYPDIPRMFKIEHTDALTVDRAALATALRRAMIGTEGGSLGHSVRLSIEPGLLGVTGRSAHSEAADEVEIVYGGPAHTIAFNAEAMIEALGCLKSDTATVRFKVANAMTPLRVECDGDESVACLTCPQKAA